MTKALLFLLIMFSCWGYGNLIYEHLLKKKIKSNSVHFIYSTSIGLGVTSHFLLIFGSLFGINLLSASAIVILGLIIAIFQVKKANDIIQIFTDVITPLKKVSLLEWVLVLIITGNILYSLLANALIPPLSYDEVAYHLAIPKIFLKTGTVSYIPFIPYSNWPMEGEMLFTLALLFSSETLAHLMTWVCFILICLLLIDVGKRWFSVRTGLAAAAIFSGSGVVTTLAGTALIELPLTLFASLAMFTFLEWVGNRSISDLSLSAIYAGLAASTKFNWALLPFFLGVLVFIVLMSEKRSFSLAFKWFIVFGVIALIVVSPWYLKSWIQTGNPLWGFFMEVFPTRNWDVLGNTYLLGFIHQPNLDLTLGNYFVAFWKISADPGSIGPVNYRLGWVMLAFITPAILATRFHAREKIAITRWLGILTLIFYTSWFFQTHQSRFFMPVIPLMALWISSGIDWLSIFLNRYIRSIPFLILIILVIVNSWVGQPVERDLISRNLPYLTGQMSRTDFLRSYVRGYDTFIYANDHLPPNAFVWMALYESRGYYLDRNYEWANIMAQRLIRLEQLGNATQLAQVLQERGFTHIIYRTGQADRYRYLPYGDHAADIVGDLLQNYTRLLYISSNDGEKVVLYQLIFSESGQ